jgi:uncharacterized damage-inducible protein DinB
MQFEIEKSIQVLHRTPQVLTTMLDGISDDWTHKNEGEGTWSVFDIVGHLIHGEKTDWIPRAEVILSSEKNKTFEPFDRFAQFDDSKGKSLDELLATFARLRSQSIEHLLSKGITVSQLELTGIHPVFGSVTLSQLLATWVVHDLNHIAQITRVMAKQYKVEVGPWREYLRILQ